MTLPDIRLAFFPENKLAEFTRIRFSYKNS